jgi:hypothetical protein
LLRRLAVQSGGSEGNAWTATKLLHIRQYKITVARDSKPVDYEKSVRLHFSQMRLISISRDMLTHKTKGIGVVKILMH